MHMTSPHMKNSMLAHAHWLACYAYHRIRFVYMLTMHVIAYYYRQHYDMVARAFRY